MTGAGQEHVLSLEYQLSCVLKCPVHCLESVSHKSFERNQQDHLGLWQSE